MPENPQQAQEAPTPQWIVKARGFAWQSLLTVAAVALFTTLILLLAGAPPLAAYFHLFKGSLGSWVKITHVLKSWVPLTLCGCGLLYTFRIGLWNIGVEGQIMLGAVFTTLVLRVAPAEAAAGVRIAAALGAGILGGGLWALIAGFLKTRGGVNEIFAGLGLNFVAQGTILWLIFGPWRRPGVASMSGTEPFGPELWLPYLAGLRISPPAIGTVLLGLILTAMMLRYSRIGLCLKAVGNNREAAFLFGVKPGRYMLLAMLLAGGFAGLAGGLQVTGVYHRLIPSISSNYGYLSLMVVMLAGYRIWATAAVAFFFACLNVGSIQLPMMLRLDSSLSGVVQGALVLTTLAVHAWYTRRRDREEIRAGG